MRNPLSDPTTCAVIIVEPTASVRFMLIEVVKELGFKNIVHLTSCKEALTYMESDPVHWMIAPFIATDPISPLHILKIVTENLALRHVQISMLLDIQNDSWCLSQAFELGLFSCHQRAYVKDALLKDFQELLSNVVSCNYRAPLVSAIYLRQFLTAKAHIESRLALERNLLNLYPGSSKVLLSLAEAELIHGQLEKGEELLSQVELLDEKAALQTKYFRGKYKLQKQDLTDSSKKENVLGIKNVVIVDPDTDVLHGCEDMLNKIGIKQIEKFDDGLKAFEWIKTQPEPDLILMEWRIAGITGPVFIQRLRQLNFYQVPIILISSLVKKDDFPLLKEMGCSELLEKPFDHEAFYKSLVSVLQLYRTPTEEKSILRKIRRCLAAKQHAEAERLIAQFLSDVRVSDAGKKEAKAEFEFSQKKYALAFELGAQAIVAGGDSLLLLNLIGKCCLQLNKYDTALQCFEKAQMMSPSNLTRLLDLAEVRLHLGQLKETEDTLNTARVLDKDLTREKELRIQLDLEKENFKKAEILMAELESGESITSFMNNKAISLVRNGRFEHGIEFYQKSLLAMPENWKEWRAIVQYNLALAYVRYSECDKAYDILKQVNEPQLSIYRKARGLVAKIERFRKTGEPIFKDNDQDLQEETVSKKNERAPSQQEFDFSKIIEDLEAKKGDVCCHQIYFCLEGHDERCTNTLKNMPSFKTKIKSIKTA